MEAGSEKYVADGREAKWWRYMKGTTISIKMWILTEEVNWELALGCNDLQSGKLPLHHLPLLSTAN